MLPTLPPKRLRPHPIPHPLLQPLHHERGDLPLHLRPPPPPRIPHPLRRQSQTRAPSHPLRPRLPSLRRRRQGTCEDPRRIRIPPTLASDGNRKQGCEVHPASHQNEVEQG